jgi:hypothetical protein
MRLKVQFRLAPDAEYETFHTDLYMAVMWERDLKRKLTDGRGIGYEDFAYWTFTHLKRAGKASQTDFIAWLKDNPTAEAVLVADETDPNPTDGAPTDDN